MKSIVIIIIISALRTRTRGLRNKGPSGDYPNSNIIEIGQNTKKSPRDLRRVAVTQTPSRNLIKGMNTWAVSLVRYSGPFLKWTRDELKQMDQRTRKLMTMHKALHPRNDVDRLYVSRKEGGRGLASIEDSVDGSKTKKKNMNED